MDALRDKYLLSKESSLKTLKDSLDRMHRELAKRDFSEVPTDKLITMANVISTQINKELEISLTIKDDFVTSLLEKRDTVTWSA